jgi:hypothetical protein
MVADHEGGRHQGGVSRCDGVVASDADNPIPQRMSVVGHGRKTNHVRGDGSFSRKRSPDAGDGCTADHCQPVLRLAAELDPIPDAGAGDPGICIGPTADSCTAANNVLFDYLWNLLICGYLCESPLFDRPAGDTILVKGPNGNAGSPPIAESPHTVQSPILFRTCSRRPHQPSV